MPICEVQRRAAEVGRIRAGEKGARGEPRKLNAVAAHVAERGPAAGRRGIRGRQGAALEGSPGEFELYTETAELPMLLPGQTRPRGTSSGRKGGCQRRCDGQHELISTARASAPARRGNASACRIRG